MAADNLAAALAAFQAELPPVHKDASAILEGESKTTGKKFTYGYKYAGLDNIVGIVLPLLGKHGLSFTAFPMLSDNGFVLRYQLMHAAGGVLVGDYPLPDPTRTKPQTIGSMITYARRYALCAVTGIAPDEDDDAAEAERDYQPEVRADGSATEAEQVRMNRGPVAGTERLKTTPADDPWLDAPKTDMTPREELPGTSTRDQLNHIFGLFNKLGYDKGDKESRLELVGEITGRPVKSSANLSYVEAQLLAKELEERVPVSP